MQEAEKTSIYNAVSKEIAAVIDGETNLVARMATVSNLLHHAFEHFIWTGFYLVDSSKADELVVGPYQGQLGCLRIPFGKGVCGVAAADRETQVVDDVHAFPGHITCDAAAESEIVVPVFDQKGALIAVLDIDSGSPAMFDVVDKNALEDLVRDCFA